MLDAASRLLLRSPGGDVLGALKPVEIARSCDPPRTTGAFYNIWPTQAEFRRTLLEHVLSLDLLQADDAVTHLLDKVADDTATHPDEAVRLVANLSFEAVLDDPAFRLQHALWARAHVDADVQEGLRQLHAAIYETMVPLYTEVMRRARRRMAPPFTVQTMAIALASLIEGLTVRRSLDPAAFPDDLGPPPGATASRDRHWTAFASLAHVLLVGMTEPDDGPDDGSEGVAATAHPSGEGSEGSR